MMPVEAPAITAEITLRKSRTDTLASAVVEIGEDTIPGFRVMRGKYGAFVAYPTGELLMSKYGMDKAREMAEVIMAGYRAVTKGGAT